VAAIPAGRLDDAPRWLDDMESLAVSLQTDARASASALAAAQGA
jgi:hypothetical protein